jgi:hypothetical protein
MNVVCSQVFAELLPSASTQIPRKLVSNFLDGMGRIAPHQADQKGGSAFCIGQQTQIGAPNPPG